MTQPKNKSVPAFHIKTGNLDLLSTLKNLRRIRHGLEEHPDALSEPLQNARNAVDDAITSMKKHQYFRGEPNQHTDRLPGAEGKLEAST